MSPRSPFHVELESERVKVVPFDLSIHVRLLLDARPPDSIYDLLPLGPFKDEEHFRTSFWIPRIETRPNEACLFAVYDKTRSSFAGIIGYLNTSFPNMSTEIGFVVIMPSFQRTHVTSNAVGLLMRYALELPGNGGMGMRRLVWHATTVNPKSVHTAKRMGFQQEGILRWHMMLRCEDAKGGNGKPLRKGDPRASFVGRDTVLLSVCWDDWEAGVRKLVEETMARER